MPENDTAEPVPNPVATPTPSSSGDARVARWQRKRHPCRMSRRRCRLSRRDRSRGSLRCRLQKRGPRASRHSCAEQPAAIAQTIGTYRGRVPVEVLFDSKKYFAHCRVSRTGVRCCLQSGRDVSLPPPRQARPHGAETRTAVRCGSQSIGSCPREPARCRPSIRRPRPVLGPMRARWSWRATRAPAIIRPPTAARACRAQHLPVA
jgi:hypothetical protein